MESNNYYHLLSTFLLSKTPNAMRSRTTRTANTIAKAIVWDVDHVLELVVFSDRKAIGERMVNNNDA